MSAADDRVSLMRCTDGELVYWKIQRSLGKIASGVAKDFTTRYKR